MKKRKKLISFVVTFILVFSFANLNVMASSITSDPTEVSYSVGYKIYDVNGNLRETGALPISEEAAAAEPAPAINYPARTLINGELMILDTRGYGAFIVDRNSKITMSFGLNRNANIFAGIYDTPSSTYLKTWDGFSGGLSIGVSPGRDTNVVGHIVNRSSDPLTVTWASFVY